MTRALRLAAIFGGALALLVALGAFLIHRAASGDALRHAVAGELAAVTGQPVSLSGSSRVVFLPWPAITIARVDIGGDDGAAPVVAESGLEARLRLFPLLAGRAEVSGLTLHRPRLTLTIDEAGRSNWRSGNSILSMLVEPPNAAERGARLGELAVRGGTLIFRDDQARRRTDMYDMDLTISWPFIGSRLIANGRARLRGEEITFQGALERPSALFSRDISPVEFTVESRAIRARLTGNAFAANEIQVEGRFEFNVPSLRRLAEWLVPDLRNAPEIGPMQGTAQVKVLDRTLTLDQARLAVDRSRGEGAMSLTFDRTRLTFEGTMGFDTLDARPFLQTQVVLRSAGDGFDSDPIRTDEFGIIDVDFRLSANTLLFGATTVRSAAISFLSRDRRIEVSLGDGQAYGGRIQGRLVTEARPTSGVRVRAMVAATGVRMEDALRELFGVVRVAGAGGFNVTLEGSGDTTREVARSMRGEATIRLGQGNLAGVDLSTLIRRIERSPVEALLDARGGRTAIEQASATFVIAESKAVTEDFAVRGPGYRLNLRGTVEFDRGALSYNGILASAVEPGRNVIELPFVIRGPWTDPVIVPNPEGLARRQPGAQDGAPNRIQ